MIVSRKDRVFKSFSGQELKRGEKLLLEVAARNPDISDNGYWYWPKGFRDLYRKPVPFLEDRAEGGRLKSQDVIDFLACRSFLLSVQATSTTVSRESYTYHLKHRVEENSLYTPYVTNGVMVLAIMSLQGKHFEIERGFDTPGGYVTIKTEKLLAWRNRKSLAKWKRQVEESPINEAASRHSQDYSYRVYRIASLHEQGILEAVPCW